MNLSYGDRKSINIPLDRNERIKFTVDWEFKINIPCRGRKCVERVCFSAHVYKKTVNFIYMNITEIFDNRILKPGE